MRLPNARPAASRVAEALALEAGKKALDAALARVKLARGVGARLAEIERRLTELEGKA